MKRKAYNNLLKWKESKSRKPLLLLGARQVGKTWLMKEFGRKEYENVAYVNCDREPLAKNLFSQDYDIRRIIIGLQSITGETIKREKTLIILDELQEAPRGLHSLKYFYEDAPEYHVMAAGSLLGLTLSQQESFPVGKVKMEKIYPMDFEEFLWALNRDNLCELIESKDYEMIADFSTKFIDLLNEYYFVGGMPEAVKAYADNEDLNEVREIQQTILAAYRMDISKHSTKAESIRIGQVLDSLPSQLSKENKKFIYGVARPGGRASDFETAIQWLVDAGIIYKVNKVSRVESPIKVYEELGSFKLFLLDVGLLCCMAEVESIELLIDKTGMSRHRGMVAEEYVAEQLISAGYNLYYWSNDKTPAELDFIFQYQGAAVPIEVKASTNVRGKSISEFVKSHPGMRGFRFSLLPYTDQGWLVNYPLYSLPFYFRK
ncbi:MAG: ATP-binding protein [Muribaculaceae bacterium]|nr:ATP-binding protein [Muribaculaceae bacterium]